MKVAFIAAGIVTGVTLLSPAAAWSLDAYANPEAVPPIPAQPPVSVMPAAPHFAVTTHRGANTRLIEIELLDLDSGAYIKLVTVDGRADCLWREDLERAKGRLEAGQKVWLHIATECDGGRVAIITDAGVLYSKLGKPVDGPRGH